MTTIDIVDELRDYATQLRASTHVHHTGADLIEQAADEVERLRAWKAEAKIVIADWEKTWIAAGRPGQLGTTYAASVRHEIERLRRAHSDAAWGANMERQGGA
ncbi:MAG: hypothetical protein ACTH4Y_08260 [Microbacterium gubbeenense]|uniref:hypothetical protein n=1 Tax=Microbacterium gubbeenense TaxID=159896 RepID=UPI003F97F507